MKNKYKIFASTIITFSLLSPLLLNNTNKASADSETQILIKKFGKEVNLGLDNIPVKDKQNKQIVKRYIKELPGLKKELSESPKNSKKFKQLQYKIKYYENDIRYVNKKDRTVSSYYTTDEFNKVKYYQNIASKIGNVNKKNELFIDNPTTSAPFKVGKLSDKYIQNTINWINFYRSFYNLSNIQNDSEWTNQAQVAAADLNAANQGLSHGFIGFSKPSYVSDNYWEQGKSVSNESNLGQGAETPYYNINSYINDSGNDVPGHREWLLSPQVSKVGVGQAGEYNDLKVYNTNDDYPSPVNNILKFPNEGVFPYNVSQTDDGSKWEVSFSENVEYDFKDVTVYDNTDKVSVPVYNIKSISNDGYGYFKKSILYEPKNSYIKPNHSYTIKVEFNNANPIVYNTKLFSLNLKFDFFDPTNKLLK